MVDASEKVLSLRHTIQTSFLEYNTYTRHNFIYQQQDSMRFKQTIYELQIHLRMAQLNKFTLINWNF
jgi:hypothetical protein